MAKHGVFAGLHERAISNLLPDNFDADLIADFFGQKSKASEKALLKVAEMLGYHDTDTGGSPSMPADDPAIVDDSMEGGAKPNWSGGKGGSGATDPIDSGTGGKGHGKVKTTTPDTSTDPGTDTGGTDTGGTDPGTDPGTGTVDTGTGGTDTGSGGTGTGSTTTTTADFISGLDTPGGFNIAINWVGTWTQSQMEAVKQAAEMISDIIIGDLPAMNGIDDVRISAQMTSIDGAGNYFGKGGYTAIRSDSLLPSDGYLKLDSADIGTMEAYNLVDDFAFHEILHALGFGLTWSAMGLTTTSPDGQLRFTGENATLAYKNVYASIAANDKYADMGVPIEMDGGSSTAGKHWDEIIFKSEIMTGSQSTAGNVVSDMTIGALQDMGYQTVFNPSVYEIA